MLTAMASNRTDGESIIMEDISSKKASGNSWCGINTAKNKFEKDGEQMIDFCTRTIGTVLEKTISEPQVAFIIRVARLSDTSELSDAQKRRLYEIHRHLTQVNRDLGKILKYD